MKISWNTLSIILLLSVGAEFAAAGSPRWSMSSWDDPNAASFLDPYSACETRVKEFCANAPGVCGTGSQVFVHGGGYQGRPLKAECTVMYSAFGGGAPGTFQLWGAGDVFFVGWGCPDGVPYDTYGCQGAGKDLGSGCKDQGNPINVATGNKHQQEVDFLEHNAFPLHVTRIYNSTEGNWRFFPKLHVDAGKTKAMPVLRSGKRYAFIKNGSAWQADPDVTSELEEILDGSNTLVGWRYTTLSRQVEEYDLDGKLQKVVSPQSISHTYSYTATSVSVTHSQGGVLTYQLDANGRVTSFTAPDGSQYSYGYDTSDRLVSVTYPNSGGTRTYHYEDTNFPKALTGITDENNTRYATWAYDSQGRAISSEHHGSAEKVTMDYTHINHSSDPRVTVTNALGKQTTYHFTNIQGVRKITQVEGHQSTHCAAANKAYTYDANGFLASSTNWLGRLTNYTRNVKGQELTRTEAVSTTEEQAFTTEWHATLNVPTKITALGYEIVYSYDASGNLLSRQLNDLTVP